MTPAAPTTLDFVQDRRAEVHSHFSRHPLPSPAPASTACHMCRVPAHAHTSMLLARGAGAGHALPSPIDCAAHVLDR